MEISVSLTGLDALMKTLLEDLPDAVQVPTLRRALVQAAEPIRAGMAARAPRGTVAPHLADSMVTKPLSPSELEAVTDDSAGVEIGPTKDFFYGYFWEFGTSRAGWVARAFARPAFDAGTSEALAILGERLGAEILAAAEKHK
jgi:HK97 gp10 family phage protein